MPYEILKNGLINASPYDFQDPDIDPECASPGYDDDQMTSGHYQKHAQNTLRQFMQVGASLSDILAPIADYMPTDEPDYEKHQNGESTEDILGTNLALALSIPAPDYAQLYKYAHRLFDSHAGKDVEFAYERSAMPLLNYNVVNAYKILRGLKDSDWELVGLAGNKNLLLKIAVAGEDCEMKNRLLQTLDEDTPFDAHIGKLLAYTNYDAFSQIRRDHSQGQVILMSEVSERISEQMLALEGKSSLVVARMNGVIDTNAPVTGCIMSQNMGVQLIDRDLRHLPRYQEYLSLYADDVMIDLCETVKRCSSVTVCEERKKVMAQLVNDLMSHGITLQHFVLRGFAGFSKARFLDTVSAPGSSYFACLRMLMNTNETAGKPLYQSFITKLMKDVPAEDIIKAARNDDDLKSAYESTGHRVLLEHISNHITIESILTSELGL